MVDKFSHKLGALLAFRSAVLWTTGTFLLLGTLMLLLRLVLQLPVYQLIPGLLVVIPVSLIAALRAWCQRPAPTVLRASLDCHNHLGGLLMAEEQVNTEPWLGGLPPARMPRLQWDSRRTLALFVISAIYVLLALAIPDRYATGLGKRPLEAGQLVKELTAQLEILAQEKIIDQPQATEVQEKLAKLGEESSGTDPARTWEALDHLRQSTAETAQKSAEEALAKLESLSQAETLATALSMAASSNLNEQVSAQAMKELGSMLQNARLEEGASQGSIPPDLLAALNLNQLSADQLNQLLQAIQSGKGRIGQALTNLAELKLIDATLLGKCVGACQGGNTNALAAFLSECDSTNALVGLQVSYGRGGRDRGRGDAPMTWSEGTSEDDAKFKEQVLPRTALPDPQSAPLVGISRSAPQLTDARETTGSGVLNPSARGGGSAQSQTILPRHKAAVARYFEREN